MGALFKWFTGGRHALAVREWATIALTISLFLLSRRAPARVPYGWRNVWEVRKKQMKFNVECSRPRLVARVTVTNLLSACATVNSERITGVYPPMVEYDEGIQAWGLNFP